MGSYLFIYIFFDKVCDNKKKKICAFASIVELTYPFISIVLFIIWGSYIYILSFFIFIFAVDKVWNYKKKNLCFRLYGVFEWDDCLLNATNELKSYWLIWSAIAVQSKLYNVFSVRANIWDGSSMFSCGIRRYFTVPLCVMLIVILVCGYWIRIHAIYRCIKLNIHRRTHKHVYVLSSILLYSWKACFLVQNARHSSCSLKDNIF